MTSTMPPFAFAPIRGLELQCDFLVSSAALFGSGARYVPSRTAVHEKFSHVHLHTGRVPLSAYPAIAEPGRMDDATLSAVASVPEQRLGDQTCLFVELAEFDDEVLTGELGDVGLLLDRVLAQGEQVLDVLRLFVFKPGVDASIGALGDVGHGVHCCWIGDAAERAVFVARPRSRFQLVQPPLVLTLADVREIYNSWIYQELSGAACSWPVEDPLLSRAFVALRAIRESKDSQAPENRARQLFSAAEHLASRTPSERLRGRELRDRISSISDYREGRFAGSVSNAVVCDLWDNVRNKLAHGNPTIASLGRDPVADCRNLEALVMNLVDAIVTAWRHEDFFPNRDAYDILLGSA